jgi:hypothetical protein
VRPSASRVVVIVSYQGCGCSTSACLHNNLTWLYERDVVHCHSDHSESLPLPAQQGKPLPLPHEAELGISRYHSAWHRVSLVLLTLIAQQPPPPRSVSLCIALTEAGRAVLS